jgi:hypothetical protein
VRLIAQRTRVALASKKAAGAKLGTPTNIILAGEAGRRVQVAEADRFAKAIRLPDCRNPGGRPCRFRLDCRGLNERGIRLCELAAPVQVPEQARRNPCSDAPIVSGWSKSLTIEQVIRSWS